MNCDQALTTQALFDRELEGSAAAAAERHAGDCPECSALLADLARMRSAVLRDATRYPAKGAIRAGVDSVLARETDGERRVLAFRTRGRSFWAGAFGGATASAAAAAVAAFLVLPSDNDLVRDVTSAHVRSLLGTHLVDMSSNDTQTIDAWLAPRTGLDHPFANVVAKNYALVGARADYVYESSAAVAVYRNGRHVVNVFAWKETEDETPPPSASRNGYNIAFWKQGDVVYCAVSDISSNELARFAKTLEAAAKQGAA